MKLVYTSLTHGYDLLKAPVIPPDDNTALVAVVVYRSNENIEEIRNYYEVPLMRWRIVYVKISPEENGVLAQRRIKFDPWMVGSLAGVEWKHAWYVDASYLIQGAYLSGNHKSPGDMIDIFTEAIDREWDVCLQEHPKRTNVFDELDRLVEIGKFTSDHKSVFLEYAGGKPVVESLYQMGSFFVNNTSRAKEFFGLVLDGVVEMHVKGLPIRDQLVVPFVMTSLISPVNVTVMNHESFHIMLEGGAHSLGHEFDIKFCVPYSLEKDLGKEYNDFFSGLKENEFGVAMDMDSLFTDSRAGRRVYETIVSNPGFDIYIPVTNHVNNVNQCAFGEIVDANDLDHHSKVESLLWKIVGTKVTEWTKDMGIPAGLFMCMKRSTWSKVKFMPGLKGVDWDFFTRAQEMGLRIGLMNGIYIYHWHRGKKDASWDHLS